MSPTPVVPKWRSRAVIDLPKSPGFRLDGRRALVTGAGRGIGLAAAAALAEAGAHVTLCARSAGEITGVADAIRSRQGRADTLVIDVVDTKAVEDALAAKEPFDILINNAGTNRPKPFVEVTMDDYEAVLNLNLRAAFFVARTVAARMVAAEVEGSIIHMSSQMGHVGGIHRSLYCASKWALEGLSKAIAVELAPHRIRSNTIAPTFIETPLTKPFLADEVFRRAVLAQIKLGRLGVVEDLMGAVVFLASDSSALITGTSIVVDGGWTAA
jgi:NAD(P)-dependent dehydrogenase (short-subunit alcohol dehydrogenase family)